MTRQFRSRFRQQPFFPGHFSGTLFGNPFNASNLDYGQDYSADYCEDYHGRPVTDSSLFLKQRRRNRLEPINGHYVDANGSAECKDYIPTYQRLAHADHLSNLSIPSAGASMLDLLVRTNPSRPDYVPLTLAQDLIDIPRQLRDVGKLIRSPKKALNSREVANHYLGAKFGWLPLFRDVQDLFELQSHLHKRLGEIQRLYTDKGLKRRIQLGRWSTNSSGKVFTESHPYLNLLQTVSQTTSVERWGTVRWLPIVPVPAYRPNDAEIIDSTRRVVAGLSVEATLKGAWDLIPWTWVVNWFTNVGNFALQYSNTIPARSSSACVMTKTESKIQYDTISMVPRYQGGGGYESLITRERYVGPATVDAHLPFLDGGRLSILSALFVQRFKR